MCFLGAATTFGWVGAISTGAICNGRGGILGLEQPREDVCLGICCFAVMYYIFFPHLHDKMDNLHNWVLVVGNDDLSKEQRRICRELKPKLAGIEKCHRSDANQSVCQTIDFFPAFCNMDTKECAFGLRTSMKAISALPSLAPPKTIPKVPDLVTE